MTLTERLREFAAHAGGGVWLALLLLAGVAFVVWAFQSTTRWTQRQRQAWQDYDDLLHDSGVIAQAEPPPVQVDPLAEHFYGAIVQAPVDPEHRAPSPAIPVRCKVCGRLLRGKRSTERGLGRRCEHKVKARLEEEAGQAATAPFSADQSPPAAEQPPHHPET